MTATMPIAFPVFEMVMTVTKGQGLHNISDDKYHDFYIWLNANSVRISSNESIISAAKSFQDGIKNRKKINFDIEYEVLNANDKDIIEKAITGDNWLEFGRVSGNLCVARGVNNDWTFLIYEENRNMICLGQSVIMVYVPTFINIVRPISHQITGPLDGEMEKYVMTPEQFNLVFGFYPTEGAQ